MKKYLVLLFLVLSTACYADFSGKVVRVIDGDTIEVLNNSELIRVRLYGIDAPEKKQAYNIKSKEFLASLIAGKQVLIEENELDIYRRVLGTVFYNNININELMVKEGWAWAYDYKGKYTVPAFKQLQEKAKRDKQGLWQGKKPIKPYDFKKDKK